MSLHGNRKLNKPFRTPSASKKFGVYVRNKRSGRVQIVRFGAKISQYSRISQLFREVYVQQYFKKQRNKKNNNFGNQLVINSSNLYNPSGENWSKAWSITENIILLINNEIEKNKKKFILVTLSNPIQVDLDLNKSNNFTKLNNIEDIFYPENRLDNFSKKNSIKFVQIAKKMRETAVEKSIFFHGFDNTKMGEGHWNKSG